MGTSQPNSAEVLESLRKRFVGTGEEHDLLNVVFSGYGQGWSQGFEKGREEAQMILNNDEWSIRVARFVANEHRHLEEFRCVIRDESQAEDYMLETAVEFLKACGARVERLKEVLAAFEKSGAE